MRSNYHWRYDSWSCETKPRRVRCILRDAFFTIEFYVWLFARFIKGLLQVILVFLYLVETLRHSKGSPRWTQLLFSQRFPRRIDARWIRMKLPRLKKNTVWTSGGNQCLLPRYQLWRFCHQKNGIIDCIDLCYILTECSFLQGNHWSVKKQVREKNKVYLLFLGITIQICLSHNNYISADGSTIIGNQRIAKISARHSRTQNDALSQWGTERRTTIDGGVT